MRYNEDIQIETKFSLTSFNVKLLIPNFVEIISNCSRNRQEAGQQNLLIIDSLMSIVYSSDVIHINSEEGEVRHTTGQEGQGENGGIALLFL